MKEYQFVWVFNNNKSNFSGGIFLSKDLAETWISRYNLTGILTQYPLNIGVLDYLIKEDLVGMRNETIERVKNDPNKIGGFTSASLIHYHYENGDIQL